MKTSQHRLVVFVLGAAVSVPLAIAAGATLSGVAGGLAPVTTAALVSALIAGLLLGLAHVMLRRDGLSLGALGLPADRRRWRELSVGLAVMAALTAGIALSQSLAVGAPWEFQGLPGVRAAIVALPLVAAMVFAEELLFRGVALRYLRDAWGDRAAIGVTAAAFGVYHVVGTHNWAMGLVFQFLMPSLAGALFAWAAIRSGGLSLPIGLHLGANWVQAAVAGFDAGGANATVFAIWRIPVSAADVQLLTAPDVIVRLPHLTALALAAVMTWMLLRRVAAERAAAPRH